MGWIGGLVGGALGLLSDDKSSGQQTQTASKEPWAAASPWLQSNINTGQQLQNYYQQSPFSAQQQQAYTNQAGNSDYARQVASSVIAQNNQFKGFDRNNPRATVTPYQLPAMPTTQYAPAGQTQQAGQVGTANTSLPSQFTPQSNPFANGLVNATPPADVIPEWYKQAQLQEQAKAKPLSPEWIWSNSDRN